MWTASPWDEAGVAFLEAFNVPFYKVGSASLTDAGLLKAVRKQGKADRALDRHRARWSRFVKWSRSLGEAQLRSCNVSVRIHQRMKN